MTSSIRREVAALVSAETLLPEGRVEGWPHDVPHPSVCLEPASEEEVALILERSSREGWRVYPSGAGSWLQGRGAPEVDILLSTRRIQAIELYDPADLTFSAGSGILFGTLQGATRANGQWLPLDPPAAERGSLGGIVSTGVSGPLRHAYGSPRDHILGLTMIAGDGRLLRWGGRVVKNVAGFDVTRLTIGSWGTLGVITSVSARLFPLPEEDRTLLLTGPTAQDLIPAARQLSLSSLPFSTAELIDPLDSSKPEAGLALRLLGTRAQVDELEARGREELGGWAGAGRGVVTLGSEESRRFHERQGCWEDGAPLVLRLSLLPSKMDRLLTRGRALLGELGLESDGRVALHLGSGVLRIAPDRFPFEGEALAGVSRLLSTLRSELEEERGSLILSEGPSELLRRVGPWGSTGAEAGLVAGLKREFDPQGILSPGRITE